jgi:hypothetical protein
VYSQALSDVVTITIAKVGGKTLGLIRLETVLGSLAQIAKVKKY